MLTCESCQIVLPDGTSRCPMLARVQSWRMSPEVVLQATEALVAKNPAIHNVVAFSQPAQSTVEHWDSYRWRVSGYVDSQPKAGSRVRTLFFAVVQSVGSDWQLEDLELQNVDQGGR